MNFAGSGNTSMSGFSAMPVLNSENTDMAKLVAPPTTEDKHIVLTRPNTVLLMATIAGKQRV